MSDTPTEFSTVPDGEPSIPKAAARSSEGVVGHQDKQLEPSIIIDDEPCGIPQEAWNKINFTPLVDAITADLRAIQHDIEQRRERIARKLEP